MRTTIDIPDTLYRAVRTRTAAEGTTLRYITVALYGDWIRRPDWHPRMNAEHVAADQTDATPKPRLPFFGMLKPRRHADGPHDMESIRASIVNGRASGHAAKGQVTLSCEKAFRKLDLTEIIRMP